MEESKIDDLIKRMTLEDKAHQLTQINADFVATDSKATVTGLTGYLKLDNDDVEKVGSVLNFSGGEMAKAIQKKHLEKNEIPLLLMQDVIHGYETMYPLNVAMGGTFDLDLVEDCAYMSGIEAKLNGVHVTFAPMVDLVRDARWGRVNESTGEDPYLNGLMARAFIRGYKKAGLGVCVKHFAGYGAAESGKDYNVTEISEYTLRNFYLPGYKECLKEKPDMFMVSFNVLNGVPMAANSHLLIDVLRNEWGFNGVVISDYNGIGEMITHGYAPSYKECAKTAITNQIDIEMMSSSYIHYLPSLIHEGEINSLVVDKMVKRVLTMKNNLGLFENPFRGIDIKKYKDMIRTKANRKLVLGAAEKSCVLLKNNRVLPLETDTSVILIGPYADERSIIGRYKCLGRVDDCISVKIGVESLLGVEVETSKGCSSNILDNDYSMIDEACDKASRHEVIIACVGESSEDSGEGASRADISLPSVQIELIKKLAELKKKLVLVVFGGRPQVLSEVEKYADAILYAWEPGSEGGTAIANLLYGKSYPSGKLTMSFPRSTGQCPIYYNHFNTGRPKNPDIISNANFNSSFRDELNSPLYPFGYGLTYTTFIISNVHLSNDSLSKGEAIKLYVDIKNIGERDGQEVVQLYIHDIYASCVRPVKELKGFKIVKLKQGEESSITFEINEDMVKFYSSKGEYEAEPGEFEVMVGFNSKDVTTINFTLKRWEI